MSAMKNELYSIIQTDPEPFIVLKNSIHYKIYLGASLLLFLIPGLVVFIDMWHSLAITDILYLDVRGIVFCVFIVGFTITLVDSMQRIYIFYPHEVHVRYLLFWRVYTLPEKIFAETSYYYKPSIITFIDAYYHKRFAMMALIDTFYHREFNIITFIDSDTMERIVSINDLGNRMFQDQLTDFYRKKLVSKRVQKKKEYKQKSNPSQQPRK
ncbi:MAG: hypothetical protein AB1489_30105 [Acidobacteriota bacterium]